MIDDPNNVLFAPPAIREGRLYRGIAATDRLDKLLPAIVREKWVLLFLGHGAYVPRHHPELDLYLIDFTFRDRSPGPQLYLTSRDFINPATYFLLGLPKQYDVVFNSSWRTLKRPELMMNALTHARNCGRPITCLWFGYHWRPEGPELEKRIVTEVEARHLPVRFEPAIFDPRVVNHRYNLARAAVLCSTTEGGPRVMAESMLAGLPYVTTSDTCGGAPRLVNDHNGRVCEPNAASLAEAIWHVLDRCASYRPRDWALENMCTPVALQRLSAALDRLAEEKRWSINLADLRYTRVDWGGVNGDVQAADAACPV
jgi:hypothetical protein